MTETQLQFRSIDGEFTIDMDVEEDLEFIRDKIHEFYEKVGNESRFSGVKDWLVYKLVTNTFVFTDTDRSEFVEIWKKAGVIRTGEFVFVREA